MKNKIDDMLVFAGLGELFVQNYQVLCLVLGKTPDFLYDNDPNRWGSYIFNTKCLSQSELIQLPKDTTIVLTTRLAETMCAHFLKIGFKNLQAVSFERGESRIKQLYDLTSCLHHRENIPPKRYELNNSWCYISGASRGIGAEISKYMTSVNMNIVGHCKNKENTELIEKNIKQRNTKLISSHANFSSPEELDEHCGWIENHCPILDCVFINAGISPPAPLGSFDKGNVNDWVKTYRVNVIAPWQIVNTMITSSKIKKNGKVFFLSSSISARLNEAAYACSKAALSKLVNDLSLSNYSQDTQFCAVDPGWISTDMGGKYAKNNKGTLMPGIVFAALTSYSCNGSWISVQDYVGLSVDQAIQRAYQIGDLKEA